MASESRKATENKPIQLVIADVDGTLVTHEKVLTRRAIDAVFKLREAGVKFAITSGRPPHGMDMFVEPLKLDQPIAAFNGGVITAPGQTTVLRQNFLAPDVVKQTVQLILQHNLDAWVYTDTTWFVREIDAPHVAREQWTVKFAPVVTLGLTAIVDRVAKVVGVSDNLDGVARCEKDVQAALGGHASAARSQPYYLDVTHPKANKGEVVRAMSDLLKIPAEQIATIGDMPNDVLMFVKSGVSIAMGNASPDVQKSATYVTSSSEEEGFANAMEQFILKKQAAAN
ncbi:MAG TPA: Cof-type HAD-IIB family hydrolase [Candidatus Eisenbacteria bacterium]|jgi:Cof subfamily protein (haloacid dehalogenase superfamily)|nr:Cof-type HAD-IIB family hydrolase [Candidatus Eisenbacteria bacterium]